MIRNKKANKNKEIINIDKAVEEAKPFSTAMYENSFVYSTSTTDNYTWQLRCCLATMLNLSCLLSLSSAEINLNEEDFIIDLSATGVPATLVEFLSKYNLKAVHNDHANNDHCDFSIVRGERIDIFSNYKSRSHAQLFLKGKPFFDPTWANTRLDVLLINGSKPYYDPTYITDFGAYTKVEYDFKPKYYMNFERTDLQIINYYEFMRSQFTNFIR